MGKYDIVLKCAQVRRLVEEKRFRKALHIVEGIDARTVKNVTDLNAFAEVYMKTEHFDEARAIYLQIYNKAKTKRVLYRLIYLSIRKNLLDEAELFYQDYLQLKPSKSDELILRYRIDKAKGVERSELIRTLEQLKREDYMEEWAYELAKLYHREDRIEECIKECSDIILWFGEGEIVDRAILLKQYHTGVMDESAMGLRRRSHLNDPLRLRDPLFEDTAPLILIKDSHLKKNLENEQAEIEGTDTQDKQQLQTDSQESLSDASQVSMESETEKSEMEGLGTEAGKSGMEKPKSVVAEAEISEVEMQSSVLPESETAGSVSAQEEKPGRIEIPEEKIQEFERHSQSGTGITQDLAREISLIYEAEQKQLLEKSVQVEMVDTKEQFPITESIMLTPEEEAKIAALEEPEDTPPVQLDEVKSRMEQALDRMFGKDTASNMKEIYAEEEQSAETESVAAQDEVAATEDVNMAVQGEGANVTVQEAGVIVEAESAAGQDENVTMQESAAAQEGVLAQDESEAMQESAAAQKDMLAQDESVTMQEDMLLQNESAVTQEEAAVEIDPRIEGQITAELNELLEAQHAEDIRKEAAEKLAALEQEELPEEAPITTMALHKSFGDILELIAADPEPAHFVLIGANPDITIGVTKRIIKVIGEKGKIKASQIARITAEKLNRMDLADKKGMLQGCCLLVEQASELSIPTITSMVNMMDEFNENIVVILADEGETLEKLFNRAGALNRRFKYVIDITGYTEADYM